MDLDDIMEGQEECLA